MTGTRKDLLEMGKNGGDEGRWGGGSEAWESYGGRGYGATDKFSFSVGAGLRL